MNTLLVSSGIQGNISNCEIETVLTNPGMYNALQLTHVSTYKVVNKCDGSIMSEYQSTEFTGFSVFALFILIILLLIFSLRFSD